MTHTDRRKPWRLIGLAAVGVVATLVPSWPANASPDTSAAGRLSLAPAALQLVRPVAGAHAQAAALRGAFGLDAASGVVRGLLADAGAVARGKALGFPLTPTELTEVQRKLRIVDTSGPVLDAATKLAPSSFAGVWHDTARGKVVAAFTDAAAGRADRLRSIAEVPEAVEVVERPFSLRQLIAAGTKLRAAGVPTTSVRPDISAVVAHVADPSATDAAELGKRAGVPAAMILVQQGGAIGDDAPSINGGEAMWYSQPCSSGGWARSWNGTDVVVTAGHCEEYLMQSNTGLPSGSWVSGWNTQAQSLGGNADAQTMLPDQPQSPTNITRMWGGGDYALAGADYLGGPYSVVGATVCQSGHATQGSCGTIQSTNFSGGGFTDLYAATYVRNGGDSGAVVWGYNGSRSVPRVGVHKGYSGSLALFSHQQRVANALGLQYWY